MGDVDQNPLDALRAQYGVAFPEELMALWQHVRGRSPAGPLRTFAHEAIAILLTGPFAWLAGGLPKTAEEAVSRYRVRRDPAEFFVVATSTTDGYRWGYWFDDPASAPLVAVYDADDDSPQLQIAGHNLTAALVRQLERTAERLEEDLQYDPDGADYYRDGLTQVSTARGGLVSLAADKGIGLTGRLEREVVAPTLDKIGIVGARESYQALVSIDELSRAISRGEGEALLDKAEGALKDGFPSTSLQIGKAVFAAALGSGPLESLAKDLMARSYQALGREGLARVVRGPAAAAK